MLSCKCIECGKLYKEKAEKRNAKKPQKEISGGLCLDCFITKYLEPKLKWYEAMMRNNGTFFVEKWRKRYEFLKVVYKQKLIERQEQGGE